MQNQSSNHVLRCFFTYLDASNKIMPQFIGAFNGVESLPKDYEYPEIYYWMDERLQNSMRLSFNMPLLRRIFVEQAGIARISVSELEIESALSLLQESSAKAFQRSLNRVFDEQSKAKMH